MDEKGTSSDSRDVIIIGAGISGINAAYRLQEQCPDRTYTILEGRLAIGGTWDLFKYPGIRSDSDLHTFGFPFRPWTEQRAMADGASIAKYMRDTAAAYGIDKQIKYHHKVLAADWSSKRQRWSLAVDASGTKKTFESKFVIFCTGYYDYDNVLAAEIPGIENFKGQVIHPQFWPEDLDYQGKDIVIIGSGATAVTLLPSLTEKAAHVTMLQRSPSYILSIPQHGQVETFFRRILPLSWALQAVRIQFLILPLLLFKFCRAFPNAARKRLVGAAASQLPKYYPMKPNFEPKYNPWDQRLCMCPGGDFFESISSGKGEVVTANIKQVTESSITLQESSRTLQPDIIITATGLKLLMAGGTKVTVDGTPVVIPSKHLWKGVMIQDVPNATIIIGYTNASWTLGADATSQFTTRLLNHMRSRGMTEAVPKLDGKLPLTDQPVLNLNSTYVEKAKGDMPKAGSRAPWLPRTWYVRDMWEAKHGAFDEMRFSRA